jgi:hypothetical protein
MRTLTDGELLDFTGTPQRKKQLEILRSYGLNPLVRPDGTIGVTWEAIEAVMLDKEKAQTEGFGVNLDAA